MYDLIIIINTNNGDKMIKKINKIIYLLLFTISFITIIKIYYSNHFDYYLKYLDKTNALIYGNSYPRGRILDRNGEVLVDNIGINTIMFRNNNIDTNELANTLVSILNVEDETIDNIKEYYINNYNVDYLLTNEEIELYNNRKLTKVELDNLKKERLTKELNNINPKKIKLYNLLNNGLSYEYKTIKTNVTDTECALIKELNIEGLTCEISWERIIKYDSMKSIYGTISKIPADELEYYLKQGYNYNDYVGISYLEKQYESLLHSTRDIYKINNNEQELIKQGNKGIDIYLSIDIKLQQEIDEIIKNNIQKSHDLKNTKYYQGSYVLVSNPNTGEIIASTGIKQINEEYIDTTSDIINSSFIVGSIIKGASMSVGYINNLIEENKKINDSCVKLYLVPEKCSYKRLGYIDDITALKTSSNYYQFLLAIKLTNNKYYNNIKIEPNKEYFDKYREVFKQFGLGTKTNIDLPNESIGITGNNIAIDLLLNLAIGQYDTYTPLQLLQYINTIATEGKRYKLNYLYKANNVEYTPILLNEIQGSNFKRIKEGFRQVLYNGTGKGYTDIIYKPAGKTGTSEVVLNKDITTINQTYAMFAPYDNPKHSIVVISPNISFNNDDNNYIAPINRYISKEVSKLVFEKS